MNADETWLVRHGLFGHAGTPLVAARLRMRRWVAQVSTWLVVVLVVGAAFWLRSENWWPYVGSVRLVAGPLVIALVARSWLGPLVLRWHDSRLARSLSVRVAHPAPWGWLVVVGRRYAVAAAVGYGGSLLIGLWTLVVAAPSARPAVAVAIGILVVLGAAVTWEVQRIVTRPTLADDELTLAVDDEIRAEDARNAVAPAAPPLLALTVLPNLVAQPWLTVITATTGALLAVVGAGQLWLYLTRRPGRQLVASPAGAP